MDKMMDKIGRELNLAVLSIIKMPRIPKPLTSHELRKIKNKTVAVGGVAGLYFRNTPQQSIFFFRFQDQNGRHDLSLGNYPDMSLAQARDTATNLRAQLANGQDLLAVRKQSQAPKQPLKDILTFKQAAKEWHSERSRLDFWGDNAKGEIRAYRILEMHVFPFIGAKDIDQVNAEDIFHVLSQIWLAKNATALKVKTSIFKIFQWAMAKNLCAIRENPAQLSGALGVLLEPLKKTAVLSSHHAACPVEEIPRLFHEISQYVSTSARACEFAILTCCRSKALRFATWDEIDLENKIWTIPVEHDKIKLPGRDRRIFLSDQAITILRQLPKHDDCNLLFPNTYKNKLSDAAVTMFLRGLHEVRMAADGRGWVDPHVKNADGQPSVITLHGTARASFRTWAKNDELGNNRRFDQEAVELCLLHAKKDIYRGAYDRANLEKERRQIMAAWGEYCFSQRKA